MVDLEAIRKRVAQLQTGRLSNVQLWKPKAAGEYTIRVMPWPASMVKDGCPMVERYFYYIGKGFGLLAPHQFGKPDPIKDFIDKLYSSGSPEDKEVAKKLRPKMQAYVPIIVKKGAGAEPEKVVVWSVNKFLYKKMLAWYLDEDVGDYTDPENGYDVKVTFTDEGRTFNGKTVLNSDVELARKSTKLAATPEEMKKLLDAIPDINDLNEEKTPDELKAILNKWLDGDADPGSDGTEHAAAKTAEKTDEETPAVPKKEKAKKEKVVEKSDDDDVPAKKQSLDEAFEELMSDD